MKNRIKKFAVILFLYLTAILSTDISVAQNHLWPVKILS